MKKITYWLAGLCLMITSSFTLAAEGNLQNTVQNAAQEISGKLDDVAITTSILAKYAVDPLLGPFTIDVSTTDGHVKLAGNVESKTQYTRALSIASATEGVSGVDASALIVASSNSPISDMYTTTKIKALLFKNQLFNGADYNAWDIHVETNNGIVFIVGQVKNDNDKKQVLQDVASIDGVKKIESDLQVI